LSVKRLPVHGHSLPTTTAAGYTAPKIAFYLNTFLNYVP
jgi:hypothetical protein